MNYEKAGEMDAKLELENKAMHIHIECTSCGHKYSIEDFKACPSCGRTEEMNRFKQKIFDHYKRAMQDCQIPTGALAELNPAEFYAWFLEQKLNKEKPEDKNKCKNIFCISNENNRCIDKRTVSDCEAYKQFFAHMRKIF